MLMLIRRTVCVMVFIMTDTLCTNAVHSARGFMSGRGECVYAKL